MNYNPRIFGAFLVGAGLIGAAYWLAPEKATDQNLDVASGVVTATAPTREYIDIADSDNDGIPDWKENFRQTEPLAITVPAESEEVYTPPNTLTGQTAISLLTNTVRAKSYGPLGQSQEQILSNAGTRIEAAALDELYKTSDLNIIDDNSDETLRAYGNRIAEIIILQDFPEETRGEIEVIQHAVYSDNPEILNELIPTINGYKNLRDLMLAIPVPSEIANEHLNLLNAYNALLIDIEGMQKAFDDPLYTMVRMKRYQDDATALVLTIGNLYEKILASGVWFEPDEPALMIVSLE